MKIFSKIVLTLIVLLSIAAGIPKIMQMQQELDFLRVIGFSPSIVSVLGLVQTSSGLLMVFPVVRFLGAVLALVALLISTVAIFVGGHVSFALASLIPVALTLYVCIISYQATPTKASEDGRV